MNTPESPNPPPSLWNPNAAACWCLIFTPAFGAFLHARNAERLGRIEEAKANRVWFYASLAYFGVVVVSMFIPTIPDSVFRAAGIGILLGWYLSLGKKQIQYVKETYQGNYQRRPWTKPLLIAFGCMAGFFVAMVILAVISDFISGAK